MGPSDSFSHCVAFFMASGVSIFFVSLVLFSNVFGVFFARVGKLLNLQRIRVGRWGACSTTGSINCGVLFRLLSQTLFIFSAPKTLSSSTKTNNVVGVGRMLTIDAFWPLTFC